MVSIVVIYVKFSIQRCLNYLSSMHSLSAAVKGSWLFLNRFLCSTCTKLELVSAVFGMWWAYSSNWITYYYYLTDIRDSASIVPMATNIILE